MREEELLLVISMKKGGIVFVFNIDEEINDPFGIGGRDQHSRRRKLGGLLGWVR